MVVDRKVCDGLADCGAATGADREKRSAAAELKFWMQMERSSKPASKTPMDSAPILHPFASKFGRRWSEGERLSLHGIVVRRARLLFLRLRIGIAANGPLHVSDRIEVVPVRLGGTSSLPPALRDLGRNAQEEATKF